MITQTISNNPGQQPTAPHTTTRKTALAPQTVTAELLEQLNAARTELQETGDLNRFADTLSRLTDLAVVSDMRVTLARAFPQCNAATFTKQWDASGPTLSAARAVNPVGGSSDEGAHRLMIDPAASTPTAEQQKAVNAVDQAIGFVTPRGIDKHFETTEAHNGDFIEYVLDFEQ